MISWCYVASGFIQQIGIIIINHHLTSVIIYSLWCLNWKCNGILHHVITAPNEPSRVWLQWIVMSLETFHAQLWMCDRALRLSSRPAPHTPVSERWGHGGTRRTVTWRGTILPAAREKGSRAAVGRMRSKSRGQENVSTGRSINRTPPPPSLPVRDHSILHTSSSYLMKDVDTTELELIYGSDPRLFSCCVS